MSEQKPTPRALIEGALLAYGMGEGVFELRMLGSGEGTISGCFDSIDKAAAAAAAWDGHVEAVYFTPNPINPALLARGNNRVLKRAKHTTSDNDVLRRRWFLIDFDPKRPAGISSTDAEHEQAIARAHACRDRLREQGWPEPLIADSGNGAHVCYRVDLPNDKEAETILKDALVALDFLLSDDVVAVDRTTYNAARIWKLPGTLARKGEHMPERPHRRSCLLSVPAAPGTVPVEQLQALAGLAKKQMQVSGPPAPAGGLVARDTGRGAFDLDQWMAQRGLPVVSAGEWQNGRKWILNPCPFNADHTNGAAYIVQFASGAVAAGCHHNGCADKDWYALRDMYEPGWRAHRADPPPATGGARPASPKLPAAPVAELPEVDVGDKNIPRIAEQCWEAVVRRNDPPTLFCRTGEAVRLQPHEDGHLVAKDIDVDLMRHELVRSARFVKYSVDKNGDVNKTDGRPDDVVIKDMLAFRSLPLPPLKRLVPAPVFAPDGRLNTTPGYDRAGQTYYHERHGLEALPVPAAPTEEQVREARESIWDLIGDFPFEGEADIAHAYAALLLGFARDLIDGPTPLHVITKTTPGTGGTLLADMLTFPLLGASVPVMTEADTDEEWRKRLTASLLELPSVIVIDNVHRMIDSGSFASILTLRTWSDRALSLSKMVTMPVRCVWIVTGNGVRTSEELTRRCIRIGLDAKVDRPWERQGFKHADLRAHARANRRNLVWAAHVLIQAWLAAGRPIPHGLQAVGMYEEWCEVIGGILQVAGIPGFLGNMEAQYKYNDAEGDAWRNFVGAWWMAFEDRAVCAKELVELCQANDGLINLGGGTEQMQRHRIGLLLRKNRNRRYGNFVIRKGGEVKHSARWQLESVLEQEAVA